LRIVPPKPNCRYHILKLVLDQQIYRFHRNLKKTIYHNKKEGLIITTMLETSTISMVEMVNLGDLPCGGHQVACSDRLYF